jgi:hypothetical protein
MVCGPQATLTAFAISEFIQINGAVIVYFRIDLPAIIRISKYPGIGIEAYPEHMVIGHGVGGLVKIFPSLFRLNRRALEPLNYFRRRQSAHNNDTYTPDQDNHQTRAAARIWG